MIRRVPIGALGHPLYVRAGMGAVDPSMGGLGAYAAYRADLGADEVLPGSSPVTLAPVPAPAAPAAAPHAASPAQIAYGVASTAATVAGIYHGYKRNESVGWALLWGVLAGAFPIVTIPIAIAQGFGKRKGGLTPNRRRTTKRRRRNEAFDSEKFFREYDWRGGAASELNKLQLPKDRKRKKSSRRKRR